MLRPRYHGAMGDHWPTHARGWGLVGPPLRPCPEDVGIVEREVAALETPRALLLGVTPELATLAWPAGTRLLAVDRSVAMVETVFPRTGTPPGATAQVGEWTALPIPPASIDVAVGDGCLVNLAYPAGYRPFFDELHRVLVPGGRLILRLFAAPEPLEPLAAVTSAGNLHALKWRIAMAIQRPDHNVRVADILAAFEELVPDRDALARATGWSRAVIDTIDVYRGSTLEYSFPTLAEVRAAIAERFVERACHVPAYELGDRCPTLVLVAR